MASRIERWCGPRQTIGNGPPRDWAASRLASRFERVAEALLVKEEAQRIVPARPNDLGLAYSVAYIALRLRKGHL
jgi:hypothetical protein